MDDRKDAAVKEAMDEFASFAADALRAAADGDIASAAIAEENAKLVLERIEELLGDVEQ